MWTIYLFLLGGGTSSLNLPDYLARSPGACMKAAESYAERINLEHPTIEVVSFRCERRA